MISFFHLWEVRERLRVFRCGALGSLRAMWASCPGPCIRAQPKAQVHVISIMKRGFWLSQCLFKISMFRYRLGGTSRPQDQRTTGPRCHGTRGPQAQGTTGPENHGTMGPWVHAATGPQEPWTGPQDQGTAGLVFCLFCV